MSTSIEVVSRGSRLAALCAAFLVVANLAPAQGAQPDARWGAWFGCWRPAASEGAPREIGGTSAVCVVPVTGTASVELATVVSGRVVDRLALLTDGNRHEVSRDGCTGWQTASWSAVGVRVYVQSELTCSGGLMRKSSGIMSLTHSGEWLDVQSVGGKDGGGVFVVRYALMDSVAGLPAEVASLVRPADVAAGVARSTASAPLSLGDIADVATRNEAGLVQAWLVERTKGMKLSLDAKKLAHLADQGVQPQVIDVLVALAYPRNFVVNASTHEAEARPVEARDRTTAYRVYGSYGWYGDPFAWDLFLPYSFYSCRSAFYRYSCYSPYSYYGYGYYPYSYYTPFGYFPRTYGYYPGGTTVVVVNRPSDESVTSPHGRVVNGRGYTSGTRTGSSGSGASPRSSGARVSEGGSSSGGSGSAAPAGSSSGGGSSGARTAVPRKP